MRPRNAILLFVLLLTLALPAATAQAQAQSSVVNSPHNLSALGPGTVRATSEQQICIFCHTPHHAAPIQPLWNRATPVNAYRVYSSNSLQAVPGQPTGSSKLCLSCHDGTIAVGSVLSRQQPIAMAGGITTLPPGSPSNLGTDLSDDHPISFVYDAALVTKNPKLRDPHSLPAGVRLDAQEELQCTTCHDAHNNQFGGFLVVDNSNSQLCGSCHANGATTVANHAQCNSCHQPHTAPSGPYLLRGEKVSQTCLLCHSGGTTASDGANIAAAMNQPSKHDTNSAVNLPDHIPHNVTCADCHGPHTMSNTTAVAPNVPGRLGQVSGVSAAGSAVLAAQFQYEICFKCHGDQTAVDPIISRQIVQPNLRLKFDPTAISYHPVEAAGKNPDVPSLTNSPMQGLTTASIVYCTDCHASASSKAAGGAGPNGPHGSSLEPLLIAAYSITDGTAETAQTYALCYRCHDRNSILADESFSEHNRHIVTSQTPCSVCHDPHGIASVQGSAMKNAHLINFDTSVVQPDTVTGKLEYNMTGPRSGACFLNCHGVNHSGTAYPAAAGAQKVMASPKAAQPLRPLTPPRLLPRRR